jgi:AcrR family transcriptional regulator
MATATASRRPRLSDDFLKANARERILAGTALAIAEESLREGEGADTVVFRGYQAATVNDIVAATRAARNTFYDCFGSKEAAALALVDELLGRVDIDLEAISKSQALDVLLIELAAAARNGAKNPNAEQLATGARDFVEWFAEAELVKPPPSDDPRQHSLPPGRHTLPAEFKAENQQTRLLCALATVAADRGLRKATIQLVCAEAGVSRRTFYEHFDNITDAAKAMVAGATGAVSGFVEMSLAPTLPALTDVVVEILAQRLVKDESALVAECLEALSVAIEAVA